jgi:hypothetical protein
MTADPILRSNAVDYTVEDLQTLARNVEGIPVRRLRLLAFLLFILAIPTIVFELLLAPSEFQLWPIVLQLTLGVIFWLMSSSRFRAHLWLNLARKSPLYAAHRFAVTPAAFLVMSEKVKSEVKWNAMPKVVLDDERLFLFMSVRFAYIVPRRAFDSDRDFQAFTASAMNEWERARGR